MSETDLPPQHREQVFIALNCCVLTVSDSRTEATDKSGALIRARVEAAGHSISACKIVPDELELIRRQVIDWSGSKLIQVILITGGTGLTERDCTFEAVRGLLEKHLDGFGELFRMLSFQEIGAAAMLSRAVAGTRGQTIIFAMPGSLTAVTLAMDRLILPALKHMAWLVRH